MKKTDSKKSFKLQTETVRALENLDLTKAVGGAGSRQISCGAPSCNCNVSSCCA
jgi:hypothetical protein